MVRLAFALLIAFTLPANAQCRLALALGFDVSSSVDPREDALQRNGMAGALLDPQVQAIALSQPNAPIALAIFEWSGAGQQHLVRDWTFIDSPATLADIAQSVMNSSRAADSYSTSVGPALDYADKLFARAPMCDFQTLDLSGDGIHNEGPGPDVIYASGAMQGVTVNGLVITGAIPHAPSMNVQVTEFYMKNVIKGPGAFIEIADGFRDFKETMTRKLIREMGTQVFGALK